MIEIITVTSSVHVKVGQQNVIHKWLNVHFTSFITFKNLLYHGMWWRESWWLLSKFRLGNPAIKKWPRGRRQHFYPKHLLFTSWLHRASTIFNTFIKNWRTQR